MVLLVKMLLEMRDYYNFFATMNRGALKINNAMHYEIVITRD